MNTCELSNQGQRELFIAFIDMEALEIVHSMDFDGTVSDAISRAKEYADQHGMTHKVINICPAGKSWALHTFRV